MRKGIVIRVMENGTRVVWEDVGPRGRAFPLYNSDIVFGTIVEFETDEGNTYVEQARPKPGGWSD